MMYSESSIDGKGKFLHFPGPGQGPIKPIGHNPLGSLNITGLLLQAANILYPIIPPDPIIPSALRNRPVSGS